MRDWSEDEEGPDPEIGIWGWEPGSIPVQPVDPKREEQARIARKRRELENQTSRSFNRAMIDLFNSRKP